MKAKLFYKKISISVLSNFLLIVVFSINSYAQSEVLNTPMAIIENVVPNVNAITNGGSSFIGPFANNERTYQLLIAESQLTNLIGKHLISITFRSNASATNGWPSATTVYNNYDIYLSGSVNPANRSFTFSENIVGTQTQVRSGSLDIPLNAFTFGLIPNNFSYDINFTTPWLYAGGNLLIEIRHNGFSGTSKSIDAVGTSATGYGSLFSACWADSYTATTTTTQGNFTVVDIKADDSLDVIEHNANDISVYPNPTSEYLFVESNTEISKISIFNMLGQIVFSQNYNNQKVGVSLAQLNSGTYLLNIENEFGIEVKKIIKK